MNEKWMKPSEVFAERLRETRDARGLSQARLAGMATERGVPMTKVMLHRIETCKRGLSLDEALALASPGVLNAVPAYMLSPPEGAFVAPNPNFSMNGEGIREWLQYGLWDWEPAPDEGHRAGKSAHFQRRLAILAQALVDALRGNDMAGMRAVESEIVREVVRHHQAADSEAEEVDDAGREL